MIKLLIFAGVFGFGVLVGGGAVSQLDFLAGDCEPAEWTRRLPRVPTPAPDRTDERAAAVLDDARTDAENIVANAYAIATRVAGEPAAEAADLLDEANAVMGQAREAEIAAYRRAAAIEAAACSDG